MVDKNDPEFIRPNTSKKPNIVHNVTPYPFHMSCNSVEIDSFPHANCRYNIEDKETSEEKAKGD